MQLDLRGAVTAACEAIGDAGVLVGGKLDPKPRFELFHAPNSICSQKVRAVLAHHGMGYRSHLLNIFKGETYLPQHVRLRMLGCGRLGVPLVATHTGSTSVSNGGCDPAVVPTLVDWEAEEVFVDSKLICRHLDEQALDEARLRPCGLAGRIDAEIDIVDNLPNYQMLAGKPPGEDLRPESRRRSDGNGFALEKVKRCERYLDEFRDDEDLVTAYSAKRAKELQAANALFTPDAMRDAYERAVRGCEGLSSRLASAKTPWLFGEEPTMADLYWIIELARMKNLGAANIWEGGKLPPIAAYLERGECLASIRFAVLDWPGAIY
jgi:2,5-dichlorohydroquinone reductive dechlorinase